MSVIDRLKTAYRKNSLVNESKYSICLFHPQFGPTDSTVDMRHPQSLLQIKRPKMKQRRNTLTLHFQYFLWWHLVEWWAGIDMIKLKRSIFDDICDCLDQGVWKRLQKRILWNLYWLTSLRRWLTESVFTVAVSFSRSQGMGQVSLCSMPLNFISNMNGSKWNAWKTSQEATRTNQEPSNQERKRRTIDSQRN